jgi:hypothetical protein
MTYYTTAEFDLTGAGSGEVIEAQIEYDIEPGFAGSRHEPPFAAEAHNIAVTHWRLAGVPEWTKAEGHLRAILEGCISGEWLVEQAQDWAEAAE